MNISPDQLRAQVFRARADWPFIDTIGAAHGLPEGLLLAVGSRETNLTDEIGDYGHGRGVFQLDDRSHTIPSPYPVDQQARDAAEHLASDAGRWGSWEAACNSYNSGQPRTQYTTGGDYGPDCMSRAAWIATNMPITPEVDVPAPTDVTDELHGPNGSVWQLKASGEVDTIAGSAFYGSYLSLPEVDRQGSRYFVRLLPRPDAKPGYRLVANDGARYDFPL